MPRSTTVPFLLVASTESVFAVSVSTPLRSNAPSENKDNGVPSPDASEIAGDVVYPLLLMPDCVKELFEIIASKSASSILLLESDTL